MKNKKRDETPQQSLVEARDALRKVVKSYGDIGHQSGGDERIIADEIGELARCIKALITINSFRDHGKIVAALKSNGFKFPSGA